MKKNVSKGTKKAVLVLGVLLLILIGLVIFINIPNPNPNPKPTINVEIYGPNEVELDEPFNYTIVVSNDGDTDLFNVSVNGSYGFKWNGNLARSESKIYNIKYQGQYIDGELIEVFVNGFSDDGERVWDDDSWSLIVTGRSYNLGEAITRGYVSAEFRGTGYSSGDAIEVKITPKIEVGIEIIINAGLFLINSGLGQNMIIAETISLDIKPKIEIDLELEVYCLDSNKNNPTHSETFYLQPSASSYHEDVIILMKSLEDVPSLNKSITAVQIAVWVVTDDISREEIRIDHSDEDIDDVKWLLENAGIDTSDKTLFRENP